MPKNLKIFKDPNIVMVRRSKLDHRNQIKFWICWSKWMQKLYDKSECIEADLKAQTPIKFLLLRVKPKKKREPELKK